MKKLLIFLIISQFAYSQTPVSFYPSYDPIVGGFGSRVDLDGNEIIVSNASTLAYVFEKNANGLQQKQVIYSPNASDGGFGYSISVENNRIAIGDPLINSVAENAGSVFIYGKTGDLYDLQQIIPSPEATANYHFGSCVKIFGNHLFIAAENQVNFQNASSNVGSVYHYLFNGTEWVFQQKLTLGNSSFFGKKIEVNDNILAIYGTSSNGTTKYFALFKLIDNNYAFTGSHEYNGLWGQFDFSLSGNYIYAIVNENVVITEVNSDGTSNFYGSFNTYSDIGSQALGTIVVNNDNLFLGISYHILAISVNFPVFHYKKTGNSWNYQSTYYGTGPIEDDDFGTIMATKNDLVIIGAPQETLQPLPPIQGNAYYIDYSLANEKFEYNAISLFPNPTNDRVFVNSSSSLAISKIEIYSVSGKLLQTQNSNFNEISLENFSTGLYFAKIYSQSDVSQTFKIVKN
jgi:hypothetical protein